MPADRVFRARVADFVGAAPFPASKADVVKRAERRNVASDVLAVLLRLPDKRYASLDELLAAVEAARAIPGS